MTTKFQKNYALPKKLTQTDEIDKSSHFFIQNTCFEVIPFKEYIKNKRPIVSGTTSSNSSPDSALGYFDFNDNRYVIINIQNDLEREKEVDLASQLTQRELQIAALVASGWSNKQVANQLHISEWTVSAHLRRIFVKLNVDSRAAMVYRCASLIHRLHQLDLEIAHLGK